LPAELRDQIYSYHFDELLPEESVVEINLQNAHDVPKPAICRTSKQVRQESAKLVYGRPMYRLHRELHGVAVVKSIRRWMSTIPIQHTKLFRSVELQLWELLRDFFGPYRLCRNVRFDYSPVTGLSMRSNDFGEKAMVILADHIAQLARNGEGGAAKGNFIFRALTSRPELWDTRGPLMNSDGQKPARP